MLINWLNIFSQLAKQCTVIYNKCHNIVFSGCLRMPDLWTTNIYITSNAILYACQFLNIQTFSSKYHQSHNFQRHCTDPLWRWESNRLLWPLNHSECQRALNDNTPWTVSPQRGTRRPPFIPHWEKASLRRKTERGQVQERTASHWLTTIEHTVLR